MKTDRGDRSGACPVGIPKLRPPGGPLGLGANGAEIDSELLALLVEMAALEAQHLRRIGHVMALRLSSARSVSRSNTSTRSASVPVEQDAADGGACGVSGRSRDACGKRALDGCRVDHVSAASSSTRSMTLRNSRTFPGQRRPQAPASASGENRFGFQLFCSANWRPKCSASTRISSGRSRSGGSTMGKTNTR